MQVGGIIGVLLSFFYIVSLDPFYKDFAAFLTAHFPELHVLVFIPLVFLFYLSRLATTLLPTVNKTHVSFTVGLFAFIFGAILLTGTLAGLYFRHTGHLYTASFGEKLAGLAMLPYVPLLYLGSPLLVGILIYHSPLIVAGVIALFQGHPATAIVKASAKRKRPGHEIERDLARALRSQDPGDARIQALIQELSAWKKWVWGIRYKARAREAARLRVLAEAKAGAHREDDQLGTAVHEMERARRAQADETLPERGEEATAPAASPPRTPDASGSGTGEAMRQTSRRTSHSDDPRAERARRDLEWLKNMRS